MGRSFCCTRKCQKGRKWRESQSKGGNLLNTDLQGVSGLKFIDFGRYDYYTMSIDDCIKDIFSKIPLEDQYTYFGRFVRGQEYKVIVQSYPYRTYGSVLLFGYASEIVLYTEGEGVITKHETNWTLTVI